MRQRHIDDLRAGLLQNLDRFAHGRAHARLHALDLRIFARHAELHALDAFVEVSAHVVGAIGAGRVKRVVACHRLQHQRRVFDRARERPDLIEAGCERDQPVAANASIRRLHADHAAHRGRLADRAAGVGAERDHRFARRDRGGAAAGAPARDAVEVPRVVGGKVAGVLGRAAHGELVAVGHA